MQETNRDQEEHDAKSEEPRPEASVKRLGKKAVDQARSAAEGGKAQLADGAEHVADALRHASEGLRSDEQDELADYTRKVADRIGQAAEAIKNRDLASMVSDVTRFAHRQPALFLGGAFTVGLIAARFLKSSSNEARSSGGAGDPQTSFDRARAVGAPPPTGIAESSDDDSLLEELTAPGDGSGSNVEPESSGQRGAAE